MHVQLNTFTKHGAHRTQRRLVFLERPPQAVAEYRCNRYAEQSPGVVKLLELRAVRAQVFVTRFDVTPLGPH